MKMTWNPQLAVGSHAPAAVEAELHVLDHVARVLEIEGRARGRTLHQRRCGGERHGLAGRRDALVPGLMRMPARPH